MLHCKAITPIAPHHADMVGMNSYSSYGGGIYTMNSNLTIYDSVMIGNKGGYYGSGGALYSRVALSSRIMSPTIMVMDLWV